MSNNILFRTILVVVVVAYVATAFTTPVRITTKRLALSMKRGRGSLKRELDDDSSSGGRSSSSPSSNWLNTNKSVKELPTEDSKVRNAIYLNGNEIRNVEISLRLIIILSSQTNHSFSDLFRKLPNDRTYIFCLLFLFLHRIPIF